MKAKFFILFCMISMLVSPVFAQDPTPVPRICEAFPDGSTDLRTSYYMGEGAGFLSSGQYDRAIYSYSCIIEQVNTNYVGAYAQRAVAYSARHDYDRAIADYTRAIELDDSFSAAYNNRGVVYAAQQKYDEALADFNLVLTRDAGYVPGYNNRAVISAIRGDYEGAIADITRAIELSNIEAVVTELRDPDRPSSAPTPEFNQQDAQSYALLGIIYSAYALDNYNKYLLLRGSSADYRIQSAAGALESRFNFELRLDDGTWLLSAEFTEAGEERS